MALGTSTFTKIEASSGTSTAAALSHTPTAGNTIVVSAASFWNSGSDPTGTLAVSGSTNGAYTLVGRIRTGSTAGGDNVGGLFYHTNVAAVAETVTITGGAGTAGVVGLLVELTGYTTQTVDVAGTPTASGTGTAVTSASTTNSQADAIYVHSICTASGANPATITPGSSFASLTSEKNGAAFPVIDQDSLTVASASARTGSATIDSNRWVSIIASFSDTPGAGGNTITSAVTLAGPSTAATLTETFILNPVAPTLVKVAAAATLVESITGTAAVTLAGLSTAATLTETFVINTVAATLGAVSTASTLTVSGGPISLTSAVTLRGPSVAATITAVSAHLGQFPDCFLVATAGSISCYATHAAGSPSCYGTHSLTVPDDLTA